MAARHSRRGFMKGAGIAAGSLLAEGIGAAQNRTAESPAMNKAAKLRALLSGADPVLSPAAHDVLSARLIEVMGFSVVTVGGSAVSAQNRIPDVGLVTINELIDFAGNIADNVDVPVFADCDDGGGSPINVYRAMRRAEKRGIAAVMYEDTVTIKHLGGRSDLLRLQDMADKIKAAVDARREGTVIIARTDSLSERHPMEEALARGVAYAEAGADVVFFSGMNLNDTPKARDAVKKPLMSTVNGATTPERLKAGKISLGVYAGQLLQIALGADYQALQELKSTGTISARTAIPAEVFQKLTEAQETTERARKYGLIK